MIDIPCVLFAGGKSSRMGQDKALLPFGDYPSLAEFQYRRLKSIFSEVFISTKTAEKFDFEAPLILDPSDVDHAPTAGFVAAFETLQSERIFVLSVDTPFVDKTVFKTLLDADDPQLNALIAKTASGTHPMVGIYHRSLFKSFQQMLKDGDHRLGKLLAQSSVHYIEFADEYSFTNLNHPHEYREALEHFGALNK